MKENKKSLQITKEKYRELNERLKDLQIQKIRLKEQAFIANENISNDAWHSTARQGFLEELRLLNVDISSIQDDLARAEIIEKTNHHKRVNIGDIVTLRCMFDGEEPEEMVVQLVTYVVNPKERYQNGVMAVTISSDLGKAIHGKLIGETVNYGMNHSVEIMEKQISPEFITLGDIVELVHEEKDYYKEPMRVQLVESIPKKMVDGIQYLLITEPLGRAIYSRAVGEVLTYFAADKKHTVQIISKTQEEDLNQSRALTQETTKN